MLACNEALRQIRVRGFSMSAPEIQAAEEGRGLLCGQACPVGTR